VAATAGRTPQGPGAGRGTPQSQVATVDLTSRRGRPPSAMQAAPSQRIVYFDFDSFVIKDEFKPWSTATPRPWPPTSKRRMVVEGHADERGSREYNLALGQKRAEAVVQVAGAAGRGPAQVEAVSFGEERPAAQGSDEAAWAKNRRAELKDRE
jgi:peptidoglycan-associated lipoprotein